MKYDRLTKVMVYGWKDKIMTDKLMHALSTMTEIALLWNPCSDLFLMDREPYVLPHVCPQKPTPSPPTTDTIALLCEQCKEEFRLKPVDLDSRDPKVKTELVEKICAIDG